MNGVRAAGEHCTLFLRTPTQAHATALLKESAEVHPSRVLYVEGWTVKCGRVGHLKHPTVNSYIIRSAWSFGYTNGRVGSGEVISTFRITSRGVALHAGPSRTY